MKTRGHILRYVVRLFTGVLPEHAPDWDSLRFTAQDDWHQAARKYDEMVASELAPSHDLDEARECYFTLGGMESDIGARNDSAWYWRRAAKLGRNQVESLNKCIAVLEAELAAKGGAK